MWINVLRYFYLTVWMIRNSIISLLCICFFSGQLFSQIKINEIMVQPLPDTNGSVSQSMFNCLNVDLGGEWVELYNTSLCDTLSLECYILGSRTKDTSFGSFTFPAGVNIPPLGFIVVGGPWAPNVDIVLNDYCGTPYLCGTDMWTLDNDYGWVGLYDPNGSIADAVFWTGSIGEPGVRNSNPIYDKDPCIPSDTACEVAVVLETPKSMDPGTEINYVGKAPSQGLVAYRAFDGTGNWQTDGTATSKDCNGPCATPPNLNVSLTDISPERCRLSNGYLVAQITGGIPPIDLDWSNNANEDSIGGLSAGFYSLTVTDSAGCREFVHVTLNNIGEPVQVNVIPPDTTILVGETIQLALFSESNLISASWDPDTTISCTSCFSPMVFPTTFTEYTVTVIDSNGCIGTATGAVHVLSDEISVFIPNAFTPESQPPNNVLIVNSERIMAMEWHIFDRWGREVFYSNDQSVGWNGRDKKGKILDAGVYVYYVDVVFQNGSRKVIRGNVALLR